MRDRLRVATGDPLKGCYETQPNINIHTNKNNDNNRFFIHVPRNLNLHNIHVHNHVIMIVATRLSPNLPGQELPTGKELFDRRGPQQGSRS